MNRDRFPALAASPWTRLDGPSGSLVLDTVAEAVRGHLAGPDVANLDADSAASHATADRLARCREAMASLLGVAPDGVIFGPSATALTAMFARAVARQLRPGDEIVCSDLDHDANVSPWLAAAAASGATVRIAQADGGTLELETDAVERLLTPRTRWVALTAASNVTGTMPDVAAIAQVVHARGARLFLDGVHALPHGPGALRACGADAVVCSGYKWFGPHLSALCVRPRALEGLLPEKIRPAPAAAPRAWEAGALPFELLPGLQAACGYLQGLDWPAVERHEAGLLAALVEGLRRLHGVALLGAPKRRTATVAFVVDGRAPAHVAKALARRRVAVNHGNCYAVELFRRLPHDACLRAGVLHYNTMDDVEALLDALRGVLAGETA